MKTHFLSLNTVLAMSSIVAAFTALPRQSRPSSVISDSRIANKAHGPLHMVATSSFDEWDIPEEEYVDDTSLLEPPRRKEKNRFVTGDELHVLRRQVLDLRAELHDARATGNSRKVLELQRAILSAQQMDAEFVYNVSRERLEAAEASGRTLEAELYRTEALEARQALPQFNLEGLWVGKYGEHGYEMINITYMGDTLFAHKVTGDKNVPKGELSFSVDLSPKADGDISSDAERNNNKLLEPIELGEAAARQWGAKYLSRFGGQGQVAAEGFVNSQFIEGQLILVNEFFSFAWVPIGHQVFFGRPSPELTLKLLRSSEEGTSDVDKARAHLKRCMEETEHLIEDDVSLDDNYSGRTQQDYYGVTGYFE